MAMINENEFELLDMEQAVEVLKQSDLRAWQLYNKINDTDGLEEYNNFQQTVTERITAIQAKQGVLYTDEGKRAFILEVVAELAKHHMAEAERKRGKRAAALDELKKRLADDIARGSRIKDPQGLEQLKAETRTALAFTASVRNVETLLRDLLQRAERDKIAAQLIATHGYMFAERVTVLADDIEQAAALMQIHTMVNKAKGYSYSESVIAKIAVKNAVHNQSFDTSPSTYLIKMALDGYLRKY